MFAQSRNHLHLPLALQGEAEASRASAWPLAAGRSQTQTQVMCPVPGAQRARDTAAVSAPRTAQLESPRSTDVLSRRAARRAALVSCASSEVCPRCVASRSSHTGRCHRALRVTTPTSPRAPGPGRRVPPDPRPDGRCGCWRAARRSAGPADASGPWSRSRAGLAMT